jgi:hypothetical protein
MHFSGGADIAPTAKPTDRSTVYVRSTLTVEPDRQTMHALWERSDDATTWHDWMNIHFRA